MRDMEFLPKWYPRLQKRKRWVVLQTWMMVLLAVGLGLWSLLAGRNIRQAQGTVQMLDSQLDESRQQLNKLDDLLALQKQWQRQYQMLQALSPHVEASRLLAKLQQLMPPEMSLLEANIDVSDPANDRPDMQFGRRNDRAAQVRSRKVNVRLLGVAPTDVDIANFLAKLSEVPYFEEVSMAYARDRSDNGHTMRQFEVTFSIRIDPR